VGSWGEEVRTPEGVCKVLILDLGMSLGDRRGTCDKAQNTSGNVPSTLEGQGRSGDWLGKVCLLFSLEI
jgi:hypothetical protein